MSLRRLFPFSLLLLALSMPFTAVAQIYADVQVAQVGAAVNVNGTFTITLEHQKAPADQTLRQPGRPLVRQPCQMSRRGEPVRQRRYLEPRLPVEAGRDPIPRPRHYPAD